MGTFTVRSESNEKWIEKTQPERSRPVSMNTLFFYESIEFEINPAFKNVLRMHPS